MFPLPLSTLPLRDHSSTHVPRKDYLLPRFYSIRPDTLQEPGPDAPRPSSRQRLPATRAGSGTRARARAERVAPRTPAIARERSRTWRREYSACHPHSDGPRFIRVHLSSDTYLSKNTSSFVYTFTQNLTVMPATQVRRGTLLRVRRTAVIDSGRIQPSV